MDCICLKRKHKRRREQKKFRPISPHISPAHSQPSTLGHQEPRLPKVNSTGLWFGTPSVYAAGPSPAYYYGRPYENGKQRNPNPQQIPRAASETRISQSRHYVPSRPMYSSHSNVYMIPPPGQRIYHSQQLAPVYEMPPTHPPPDLGIYDVYQFAGAHSRSKLIETKHSQSYNTEFWLGGPNSRLERSKSDAQDRSRGRHEPKRQTSKDRASVHSSGGPKRNTSSRDNAPQPSRPALDSRVSRSQESLKGVSSPSRGRRNEAHTNQGFASDSSSLQRISSSKQREMVNGDARSTIPATIPEISSPFPNGTVGLVSTVVTTSEPISPSATDSMKLLAKNKTDDQKTIVSSSGVVSVMVDKDPPEPKELNHHHYVYQGDIYAVPNKAGSDSPNADNPILSRMKEMVLEKSRTSAPNSPRSNSLNLSNVGAPDSVVYQEINTKTVTTTEEVTTMDGRQVDVLDGLNLPDASELGKEERMQPQSPRSPPGIVTAPALVAEQDTGETTSPAALRTHSPLSPIDSLDGTPEDINKAGKRITESAFTFLDKYLSDDEGTDTHVESPPISPKGRPVQPVA